MEEHVCHKEEQLKRLIASVDGNGKPGLRVDVAIIKEDVAGIKEMLNGLATSVSALVKYQDGLKTIDSLRQTRRLNTWQRTAIVVTAIITGGTFTLKLIEFIINN